MLASVMFGLAGIELEYCRERQATGIALAKKRGACLGRLPGLTKATPTRAMELRAKGLAVPEIANALGVSAKTAFRYLASVG